MSKVIFSLCSLTLTSKCYLSSDTLCYFMQSRDIPHKKMQHANLFILDWLVINGLVASTSLQHKHVMSPTISAGFTCAFVQHFVCVLTFFLEMVSQFRIENVCFLCVFTCVKCQKVIGWMCRDLTKAWAKDGTQRMCTCVWVGRCRIFSLSCLMMLCQELLLNSCLWTLPTFLSAWGCEYVLNLCEWLMYLTAVINQSRLLDYGAIPCFQMKGGILWKDTAGGRSRTELIGLLSKQS